MLWDRLAARPHDDVAFPDGNQVGLSWRALVVSKHTLDVRKSYWEDVRWAREHSTELHRQYEDVWGAIADRKVAASASDMMRAKRIAARKTGRRPEEIPVTFVEKSVVIYGQSGAFL